MSLNLENQTTTEADKLKANGFFGGICHETRECFLTTVSKCHKNILLPIICKRIRPGSIFSDC